jgi:hypothetical protein
MSKMLELPEKNLNDKFDKKLKVIKISIFLKNAKKKNR